jgi:hypothetical protein
VINENKRFAKFCPIHSALPTAVLPASAAPVMCWCDSLLLICGPCTAQQTCQHSLDCVLISSPCFAYTKQTRVSVVKTIHPLSQSNITNGPSGCAAGWAPWSVVPTRNTIYTYIQHLYQCRIGHHQQESV